jgi:energy-coupling factor transport system ATP-binding protein
VVTDGKPEEVFWNFEAMEKARIMQPYVSRLCRRLGIGGNIIRLEDAIAGILELYS